MKKNETKRKKKIKFNKLFLYFIQICFIYFLCKNILFLFYFIFYM